jgi:hypothetical protein
MEGVGPTPALQSTYNHAGVLIRPHEGPTTEERSLWEEALREVKGFEWQGPRTAEDPDPPSYRVANLRRQDGMLYAVVTTSYHQTQYDHLLKDIKMRMFRVMVADKVQVLPYMLSWSRLRDSCLTLDFFLLRGCATSYQDVTR